MTETGSPNQDGGDETSSELGRALGRLKRDSTDADEASVSNDAPTRMSWSSVTDTDDTAQGATDGSSAVPPQRSESSFRFDLGEALAKVGDPTKGSEPPTDPTPPSAERPLPESPPAATPDAAAPPAAPPPAGDAPSPGSVPEALPKRGAPAPMPSDQLPRRRTPTAPAAEELPQRRSPAPVGDLPRRRNDDADSSSAAAPLGHTTSDPTPSSPDRSVFDTANPAPALPRNPQRAPVNEPVAPVLSASTAASLPTLPASNPAAPPPMALDPAALGGPDVHAVRTFELKHQRDQRKSRVFGFTFLALLVLGAVVAVGLLFGRDWLFPTQWNEDLIPLVDEIQLDNGAEFAEPVPLEDLASAEYATVALEASFGDDWAAAFPQWRALGLASGSVDSAAIADTVVAWRPVVYDADAGVIYRAERADDTAAERADDAETSAEPVEPTETAASDDALRLALLQAFDDQRGIDPTEAEGTAGLTGVSSPQEIAAAAVDRALLVGSTELPEIDPAAQIALPLLYEMIAVDVFGDPIIDTADVDPAPQYGDDYPAELLDALVVDHELATIGPLPEGAEALGEPRAIGPDGWQLVWQNRLPDATTVRLRSLIGADAYLPFVQGGKGCVAAAFQTQTDINAGEVVTALTSWARSAPLDASPTIAISTADPARVEFVTCDPGAAAEQSVDPATITGLIDRQLRGFG